jgi:hypothetical protein
MSALHRRTQEINQEYWAVRETQTEDVAIAQLCFALARAELAPLSSLDVERLARAVHVVEQGTSKTVACYHDPTTGAPVDCMWTAELLAREYVEASR